MQTTKLTATSTAVTGTDPMEAYLRCGVDKPVAAPLSPPPPPKAPPTTTSASIRSRHQHCGRITTMKRATALHPISMWCSEPYGRALRTRVQGGGGGQPSIDIRHADASPPVPSLSWCFTVLTRHEKQSISLAAPSRNILRTVSPRPESKRLFVFYHAFRPKKYIITLSLRRENNFVGY